jgi:hypothetical protein
LRFGLVAITNLRTKAEENLAELPRSSDRSQNKTGAA